MFVYDFVPVTLEFTDAREALLSRRERLTDAATRAYESAARLASSAAAPATSGPGMSRLALGPARRRDDTLVVPIHWAGGGAPGLFATLDGDLQLAPFGPCRSHLSLSATYDASPGGIASRRDARVVRRATETGVRAFLAAVGQALETTATAR